MEVVVEGSVDGDEGVEGGGGGVPDAGLGGDGVEEVAFEDSVCERWGEGDLWVDFHDEFSEGADVGLGEVVVEEEGQL